MIVGIPKEVKNHEYRVGATPGLVHLLVSKGHQVLVQMDAGLGSGFDDEAYRLAGAKLVNTAADVYKAEMILKVKEPQKSEFPLLRKGQILFCYLHLAPDPDLLKHLLEREIIGIAFETVTKEGILPLLAPMSEVAGKIAVQMGASALQLANGGRGVLLGGIPGVLPAKVVVIGGGFSGRMAAGVALGMGADVTLIDIRLSVLKQLDSLYGPKLKTLYSTPYNVEEALITADLVIGSVLIPGKKAPKVITESMIKKMQKRSVFVDIAIDQGGCSETSKVTSFSNPTYVLHNVVHSCVDNLPGSVARTSTQGLTNALTPYVMSLADLGYKEALKRDEGFREGLNVCLGSVTNASVVEDGSHVCVPPEKFL
jgi:alanine dehydrogenase